jgi:MYXO-CTERM domain-containing protein
MTDRTKIGSHIAALGYGITSPSASDSGVRRIREKIAIKCVPGDETYDCKGGYESMLDSDKEFITEGYVCSGDSGGGAFDQESFDQGAPYVLGALSRGPQTEEQCLAAIYSRTDAHAEMIIAAGKKAAKAGGYADPAWLSAPVPEATEGELGTTCEGETCTAVDATEAAPPATITTTTTGCSSSSGASSSGTLGLAGLAGIAALVVARRRRRAA